MTKLSPEQEKRLIDYQKILESIHLKSADELLTTVKEIHKYTDDASPALHAVINNDNVTAEVLGAVVIQIANCKPGISQTIVAAAVKSRAEDMNIIPSGYTTEILKMYLPKQKGVAPRPPTHDA